MTNTELFRKEAEEIQGRTGFYIPPYRMASLMKTAQKIMDLLTKSDVAMSYQEIRIILDIVRGAVNGATGEENGGD